MADDTQPRKQAVGSHVRPSSVGEGIKTSFEGVDLAAMQRGLAALREGLALGFPAAGQTAEANSPSSKAESKVLKPAIAGGDAPTKTSNRRRSKVLTVGGVRSVRYYYWTIHELGMLGSRRASALRSYAIAAFCGGLVADGIKDALLNPPPEGTAKGVWATLLVVAAVVGLYNAVVGFRRSKGAEKFQKEVIDEHDFGE